MSLTLHNKIENRIGKGEGEMKKWREAYKAMVLLEFLLTHGPLHLPHDFLYDLDHIRFLSTFQYVDDKGYLLISKRSIFIHSRVGYALFF